MIRSTATILLVGAMLVGSRGRAQDQKASDGDYKVVYTTEEQQLVAAVRAFSDAPYDMRNSSAKALALGIRQLPAGPNKLRLADALATASTAGDSGREGLQEIATTLAEALHERPPKSFGSSYDSLAQLVHYEHVNIDLNDPELKAAIGRLEDDDRRRQEVDFTLTDLSGKKWSLKDLHGKVVMVSFFASASRPCWQEVVELQKLSQRFKKDNLVVLGISYMDDRLHATNFAKSVKITYPILLDPGQKVAQQYRIVGVPKTFVYNREGKLVAQALDMRTGKQLAAMLKDAGLE